MNLKKNCPFNFTPAQVESKIFFVSSKNRQGNKLGVALKRNCNSSNSLALKLHSLFRIYVTLILVKIFKVPITSWSN